MTLHNDTKPKAKNPKYLRWTNKILNKKQTIQETSTGASKNDEFTSVIGLKPDSALHLQSTHCRCCGTTLNFPNHINRIKCLVCNTYFSIGVIDASNSIDTGNSELATATTTTASKLEAASQNVMDNTLIPPASLSSLKLAIKNDELLIKTNLNNTQSIHKAYKNVDALIEKSFGKLESLNSCFQLKKGQHQKLNLNLEEIKLFYNLLIELPTKRPIFKLLTYSLYLLKHPPLNLKVHQLNWILIILEIPLLYQSLIGKNSLSPHFNDVCYDITKRILGIISMVDKLSMKCLIDFWSRLPVTQFVEKVNFINLYITFHINRLYTHSLFDKFGQNTKLKETEDDINYKEKMNSKSIKSLNSNYKCILDLLDSGSNFDHINLKISISSYSECWHLRTACHLMSYLFHSNQKYHKVEDSCFYNSLVDYVNVRQDYDVWQFNNSFTEHEKNSKDLTNHYLLMEKNKSYLGISVFNGVYKRSVFTLCSYPFLISLGSKISILEHDAKREMILKAEQAFINSFVEGQKNHEIYFKMNIRREFITTDSLKQIQSHPNDVRKLLKINFINEQGIDAGGLKKEWFLLLTKELFDLKNRLITYNNENQFAYFAVNHNTDKIKYELYYLLGVVVGMAIYNSIILDIKFPKLLYKKLLGFKTTFEDLFEIEPTIAKNLKQLGKMTSEEISNLSLNFEITIVDINNVSKTYELVENGSELHLNASNKFEYISKYSRYLLDKIVEKQFVQFSKGFRHVMGNNILTLFTPAEIQKLIIGDDNLNESNRYDIEILKNISKFKNCDNQDIIVIWFWEYFNELSIEQQKKLMRFVTGSDRIPATGLTSLTFKVTKLRDISNVYSERLPISHTCFNEICLWEYKSKDALKAKIDLAINESEGFGLK